MTAFAYAVRAGQVESLTIDPAQSVALHGTADLLWVHLITTDAEAQAWLGGPAGLGEYVVGALTAVETRPRCDSVAEGAVLNLRGLSSEVLEDSDPLASIRVFAARGRVFSVTRQPLVALATVRQEIERGEILDPGDLITALAGAITENLDPVVAELGDRLDDCEEELSADRAFVLRRQVNAIRVRAIGYRRFLNPQRAALEKLAALPGDWLTTEDRLHLNAAADRAARMAEEVESIRERAALAHETLTDLRAEQIDQRSLIIAVAALVFLPVTFLTGLFGMNVDLPFQHSPQAFWGIIFACVGCTVAIIWYFFRRQWFSR